MINEEKNDQLNDQLNDIMNSYRGKVEEFLLQDLQPDTQRLEIEEVARVIITPFGVEVYTFDDMIYMIEIGGTKIKQMEWKENGLEEKCNRIMTVKH
jgi:hypothetical protein